MTKHEITKKISIWDPAIVRTAAWDAVRKLNPVTMLKNPVMFVVEVGSVLTTVLCVRDTINGSPDLGFALQITAWLWFTVLFANFAEAMAEGYADGRDRAVAETGFGYDVFPEVCPYAFDDLMGREIVFAGA